MPVYRVGGMAWGDGMVGVVTLTRDADPHGLWAFGPAAGQASAQLLRSFPGLCRVPRSLASQGISCWTQ